MFAAGCSSPACDNYTSYGDLMYADTDSLLHVVTAEDTALMTDDELMLHRLMDAAASFPTGQFYEDTTALAKCESYYESKGCDKLHATALLLHAEHAFNNFEHKKALVKLLKAHRLAIETGDDALISRIYSMLYRVNRESKCITRSMDFCKKAVSHARRSGYTNLMVHAGNDMASLLIAGKDYAGAMRYLEENGHLLNNADKRSRCEYFRVMGEYYLATDSLPAARDMLAIADSITPTAETFYDIALTYEKTGDKKQMVSYCYSAITADKRGEVSIMAYNKIIENLNRDADSGYVLNVCRDLNFLYLKKAEFADAMEIEKIQAGYDFDDVKDYKTWILLAVAMTIVFIVMLFYLKSRRKADVDNGDALLLNESIVYDMHKVATSGGKASQEQWIALHQSVNRHIPFFLANLHKINDLSARDINVCILTRLHFSPSEIGVLTDISPQNVTNIRARLLGKIFGVRGGAAEFDRRISAMKR